MRGSEGLARAAQAGWFTEGDVITMGFYFGGTARLRFTEGEMEFDQSSSYPLEGRVQLRVTAATTSRPKIIRLFAPIWSTATSFRVTRNGESLAIKSAGLFAIVEVGLRTGDELKVEFPLRFGAVPLQNPARQAGHHRFAHGPLLLGHSGADPVGLSAAADLEPLGAARYRCTATGLVLGPLPKLFDLSEAEAKTVHTQLVFAD